MHNCLSVNPCSAAPGEEFLGLSEIPTRKGLEHLIKCFVVKVAGLQSTTFLKLVCFKAVHHLKSACCLI